jgi:anaerobic magnesium-protoporphyrin IX monomethyl ester cyclase
MNSGSGANPRVLLAVARPEVDARHVQPPIEMLTCAAVLAEHDADAVIFDSRVEDTLPAGPFALVMVLTQTYDRTQCYSLQLDRAQELLGRLRSRFSDAPLVVCGVHGDLEPAMTADAMGVPSCLPGEVEVSVPWLFDRLVRDGVPLADIDLARAPRQVNSNSLPTPRFDAVDLTHYRGEVVDPATGDVRFDRAGLLFANRGCPYTCSYCHVWFGRKLRMRAPERVVDDVRALAAAGTNHFFFLDYTFTFDKVWTSELCRQLAKADLGVSWVCQTRCENVDREVLEALRSAGCVGVYYGIEAPWIAQTAMRKHTKRELIDRAIGDTVAVGLHPFVFVLLGLDERDQDRQDELTSWLRELPATFSARPLLPRPHTRLFEIESRGSAGSWDELDDQSTRLGYQYWPPELATLERRLLKLPNNVLNAPTAA